MLIVLMLVVILDAFSTNLNPAIAEQVANSFFPSLTDDQQTSMLQFGNAVVSIGMLVVFLMQYLADKIGRKKSLAITALGMGLAAIGMLFSPTYIMYVIFWFFLSFFMNSDIFLIYVNEEAKAEKRARTTNLVLAGGLTTGFIVLIFRMIFASDAAIALNPDSWRGMLLFPIILGIIIGIVILATLKETTKYLEQKDDIKRESRNLIQDVKCCFEIEEKVSYKFLMIANFFFSLATAGYIVVKVKYMDEIFTDTQINILILLNTFLVIIAFILNALSDRVGRKKIAYIWTILLPISVILMVIGTETASFGLALLANTINGIAFYGMSGLFKLMTLETLPNDRRGTGTGVRQFISAIAVVIGMFTSAIVVNIIPTGTMFIIFSCLGLLAIPIIALKVKDMKGVDLNLLK
jgi:MFS family permease